MSSFSGTPIFFLIDDLRTYIVAVVCAVMTLISFVEKPAIIKQLGIIKMVAETPTEQNREMLRKISSIDRDTNGALINRESIYEIIDNLYSQWRRGDVHLVNHFL